MKKSNIKVIGADPNLPSKMYLRDIPTGTYFAGRIAAYQHRFFFKGVRNVYALDDPAESYWDDGACLVEGFRVVDVEIKVVTP